MWQELMKKAINATTSSMVLANKYKQMKNKVQQTQMTTAAATSSLKTTQKQYVSTPKMTTISSPQTSVMKPVGARASQNQSKNQSWKDKGKNITTTSNTTATSKKWQVCWSLHKIKSQRCSDTIVRNHS